MCGVLASETEFEEKHFHLGPVNFKPASISGVITTVVAGTDSDSISELERRESSKQRVRKE